MTFASKILSYLVYRLLLETEIVELSILANSFEQIAQINHPIEG